jgi:hypothetical protein
MSSLVDAIIASDTLPSSSIPHGSDPPPSSARRKRGSSRALPSESNAHSDNEGGLPDDEVVGARGTSRRPRGPQEGISMVVDEIGEHMVQQFEDFLETYVYFGYLKSISECVTG